MSLPFGLAAYRGFSRLAAPLVPLVLGQRTRAGKEDPTRRHERLGRPTTPRPEGVLVWMHGASVGESLMIATLIDSLSGHRPDLRFLVTTGTMTSAALMANRLPGTAIHQYVPVDTPAATARFLDHWQPDLAIFAESEIWPNLILETARHNTPMALVNARMNEKSLANWRKRDVSARWLFACFDWIGAADLRTCEGLENLIGERVPLVGNLKLEAKPAPIDKHELARIRVATTPRAVWLAASTHAGEEAELLKAHKRIRETYRSDALLILAPRHPERADEVAQLIKRAGLKHVRRSERLLPDSEEDVWLADTLGEMGLWYAVSKAAFIGGSLKDGIGGHNPIEASQAGSSVISGPYVASFQDVFDAYRTADAVRFAETAPAISEAVGAIWAGEGPTAEAGMQAVHTLSGGALDTTVTALLGLLETGDT